MPEPNTEPGVDPNAQVVATIQRMTDLLAHFLFLNLETLEPW